LSSSGKFLATCLQIRYFVSVPFSPRTVILGDGSCRVKVVVVFHGLPMVTPILLTRRRNMSVLESMVFRSLSMLLAQPSLNSNRIDVPLAAFPALASPQA
jgi:hypothetical protein